MDKKCKYCENIAYVPAVDYNNKDVFYCKSHFQNVINNLENYKAILLKDVSDVQKQINTLKNTEQLWIKSVEETIQFTGQFELVSILEEAHRVIESTSPNVSLKDLLAKIIENRKEEQSKVLLHPDEFGGSDY